MSKLPSRVNRLAKQLGVPTPEDVVKLFEKDSGAAADVLVDVLNTMIASINANSRSGVLSGYTAVKEAADISKIRLPQSGIDISGRYEWIVYVKAPTAHAGNKTNVFDRIDSGRPQLPYRDASKSPYPLWAAALRSGGIRRNVQFPSNARISGSETSLTIGSNPLGAGSVSASRSDRNRGSKGSPMVFSRGPIAAIPAKFLYENAVKRAKDRLSIKGFSQYFDVVLVQREDFGVK